MQDRTLRTIGATVVLAVLVVIGISQVGSDGDAGSAEIVAATSTTTVAGTSSSVADPGTSTTQATVFVYRVGLLAGISTDNFWAFYGEEPSVWNSYVLGPTKPALFTSNTAVGVLEPELAATEPPSAVDDDGWQVTVDLDSRMGWSDGTPVTAHDLVFTFDTVRALGLGGSWAESFPEVVEAVVAEDDHRVRIEFSERPRLSVWPHAVGLAPIMARHVWEPETEGTEAGSLYAQSGQIDVSGGPLVVSSVSENLIVGHANDGYPHQIAADTVEYHVFTDEPAAVAALDEGTIDTILSPKGLLAGAVETLEANPDVEVVTSPGNGVRYLGFNLDREPMSDRAFRTALALLLDRSALADEISQTGPVARSIVPEANTQWFDSEAAEANSTLYEGSLADRLDRAVRELASAGYEWKTAPSVDSEGNLVAGTGLTIDGQTPQPLTILTPGDEYDPARPDYVAGIAETLAILGFDARPVETDFDSVVDLAFTPREDGSLHYDMYMLGWTLGNQALPGYYRALFAPDGEMNNTGYDSEAFATALDRYESAFTTDQAFDALWEMERVLAEELPYLLLYSNEITEAYRSDRVILDLGNLGGLQARLGAVTEVEPSD